MVNMLQTFESKCCGNKTEPWFCSVIHVSHILVPIVMDYVNSTPTTGYFWHATWVETLRNSHPLIKKLHTWGLYYRYMTVMRDTCLADVESMP